MVQARLQGTCSDAEPKLGFVLGFFVVAMSSVFLRNDSIVSGGCPEFALLLISAMARPS